MNNPILNSDPSGKSVFSIIGDAIKYIAGATVAIAALALAFSPVGLAAAAINPSWWISNVLLAFNFSPVGLALNLAVNRRLPKLSSFQGRTVVEDSFLSGGVGFTPGAVSFLPNDSSTSLKFHEIGHQLQYERYGGWSFFIQGIDSLIAEKFGNTGLYDTPFECEAGMLSHNTFGLGYYPDTGYSCPGR